MLLKNTRRINWRKNMDVMFKFLMWFAISFPILVVADGIFPSRVFFAFIIALIFGFLAVRNDQNA